MPNQVEPGSPLYSGPDAPDWQGYINWATELKSGSKPPGGSIIDIAFGLWQGNSPYAQQTAPNPVVQPAPAPAPAQPPTTTSPVPGGIGAMPSGFPSNVDWGPWTNWAQQLLGGSNPPKNPETGQNYSPWELARRLWLDNGAPVTTPSDPDLGGPGKPQPAPSAPPPTTPPPTAPPDPVIDPTDPNQGGGGDGNGPGKPQPPNIPPPPGPTPPPPNPPPPTTPPPTTPPPTADPTTKNYVSEGAFEALLGNLGIPANVIAEIFRLFGQDPDTNRAVANALAFVRGTPWYKQAFPGINEGMAKGIFSNEKDYRQWRTQVDAISGRFGATPTAEHYTQWAAAGYTPDYLERRYVGMQTAATVAPDVRYTLGAFGNDGEAASLAEQSGGNTGLEDYGLQIAGLNNPRGLNLQQAFEKANAKMQRVFQGVLATPGYEQRNSGIAAASLASKRKPDIAA